MKKKGLPRLLVVDDEALIIRAMTRALRGKVEVLGATGGEEALELLGAGGVDVVLAEVSVTCRQGRLFVRVLEESHPEWLRCLILTSGGLDLATAYYYRERYGCPLVLKPADATAIDVAVAQVHGRLKQIGSRSERRDAEGGPAPDPPAVLVVDDDPDVNKALKRLLSRGGFRVLTAPGPMEAISILREQEVAVAVVDQMMPGMTGIELLSLIRQSWPATVGMLITASNDIQVAAEAINRHLVHYFVPKPWNSAELRGFVREAAQVHRSQRSQAEWLLKLNTSFQRQIKEKASKAALSIARAVDARDGCTRNHSKRVAAFALAVGRSMGLGDGALSDLRVGALLHDVGKLAIPEEILLKPGKLTGEEFEEIKTHPAVGASIVGPLELPGNVTDIIRQHHENHDGSGYPAGIGGGDIALPARIIHAADALEAMSSDRVYRKAPLPEWAPKELQRYRSIQFDPQVIDVLLGELQAGRLAASE